MKGVLQGDTLSPIIYIAAVEEIFKRIEWESGININGVRLNNLRFADDIIPFAEKEGELEKLLVELNVEGKKDGMKLNKRKRKIMCNEIAQRERKCIEIEDEVLQEVEEYRYLGKLFPSGNNMEREK